MIKQALPPAAVLNPAMTVNSGLDLERWPRWMSEAFAVHPDTTAPARTGAEVDLAHVDPASVRKLTRMPSQS